MTDQRPTPSLNLELVKQWATSSPIQANDENWSYEWYIALHAAEWAFHEAAALDDLRDASAEASGVEPNSQSTSNDRQIRSSDITPPPELVVEWRKEWIGKVPNGLNELDFLAQRGAQWAANAELDACCKWLERKGFAFVDELRAARRPKPQTLNSVALQMLDAIERDQHYLPEITNTIRRALEQLPDHE